MGRPIQNYVRNRVIQYNMIEGGQGFQKILQNLKVNQGENLNNIVTAVGTAGVAPIFIINNPLAKEDKDTKKYTAARQPISAAIALGIQLPVMTAYNNLLDRVFTTWGLDRCDMKGKPLKSYLMPQIKHDYKVHKDTCLSLGIQPEKKSDFYRVAIENMQDKAFYREIDNLRNIMKDNNLVKPKAFASSLDTNGFVKLQDMISPNDVKEAEQQLFGKYIIDKYGFDPEATFKNKDGEFIKIKSLDDLKDKANRKLFKSKGVVLEKADKKAIKQYLAENYQRVAQDNVSKTLHEHIKIKLFLSREFEKMNMELNEYKKTLLPQNLGENESRRLIDEKTKKIFDSTLNKIKETAKSTPEVILDAEGNIEALNKKQILRAVEKMESNKTLENMKYHGATWDAVKKSVQAKKWYTAKLNHSEVFLKDFKQKSGLILGLAILPITCGILNWAYPRIMEEWFPHLAHAKKAAAAAKGAK